MRGPCEQLASAVLIASIITFSGCAQERQNPLFPSRCLEDPQCGAGQMCIDGVCAPQASTQAPAHDAGSEAATIDRDVLINVETGLPSEVKIPVDLRDAY